MFSSSNVKEDPTSSLRGANLNEQAREDLYQTASQAGRHVRDFIDSTGNGISHATDTVTTRIRTNPVQSSLIALGVGFVLGALLRR